MTDSDSVFKEFRNWCIAVDRCADPSSRESMKAILNEIELVYLQMSRLDVSSLGSLAEAFSILDTTSQAVDRLWTNCPNYEASSIQNFLDLISAELTSFLTSVLENYNMFDNTKPARTLSLCYKLIKKWMSQTKQFTSKLWPAYTGRKWNQGVYQPESITKICTRLGYFSEFRRSFLLCAQYELSYLPPQLPQSIVDYINGSDEQFESIKEDLNSQLQSFVEKVVAKIADNLKSMKDNQDILADELQSLKFLSQFSSISKITSQYEEKRNNQFITYLELMHKQVSTHLVTEPDDPNAVCEALKWFSHQLHYSKNFMKKIPPQTTSIDDPYQKTVSEYEKCIGDMMNAWITGIGKILNAIDFDQNLIIYEVNQKTRVISLSFPKDKLEIINQESSLLALNFRIPRDIEGKMRKLRDHHQYFCALKQICDHYNTTVINIIKPLRPLMIPFVDGFINQFESISTIPFTQPSDVETFISACLQATSVLSDNNDQLMSVHKKFINDIANLFDCSLITAEDKWKSTLKQIRGQMAEIYRNGKTNIKGWIKHMNSQIYKALDFQFEKTLTTMESDVQRIQINVSYSRPNLVFEPSIANLRQQLYGQITRLIGIPTHFSGVSFSSTSNEFASLFAGIVKSHLNDIDQLYKRTEVLINKVYSQSARFNQWIILGQIEDFDATISQSITDSSQFLTNLNSIVSREAEIEAIPDIERFEFITVSYIIAKSSFRRLVGEYKRSVCNLLRKSLEDDISTVMDFINTSLASIQTNVTSSEEVKRVKETIVTLNGKIKDFSKNFKVIHDKSNLLMIHDPQSRQSLQFQMDSISSHWQIFHGALADQSKIVQQQLRTLRTLMNQKVDDFQRRTTQFKAKWEERKPKDIDFKDQVAVTKAIQIVKETKNTLAEFNKEKDMLLEEEASFGIKSNRTFPDIAEVTKSLQSFETTWLLLDDYQSDLDKLCEEDWISFRHRLYELKDVLDAWKENAARQKPETDVTRYIIDKVEDLITFYPSLKYVQGNDWVAEHWEELGIIIKFPRPMKLNELKLGDIVKFAGEIHNKSHQIKELCDRAKGEGTIRAALREIREWNMHTDFQLFEQLGVSIIKEWKDLLTQVSDQQATIQSLSSLQFSDAFESEIQLWTTKFTTLHESLLLLNQIQRKWLHLAPIFNSGALPSHTEKFNALDTQFKSIMGDIKKDPQVTSLLNKYDIVSTLKNILDGLDACQTALTAFLESKRQGFPRLYFIGDFDLLEILGKVRENPNVVQTHLKNLFQGISSIEVDSEKKVVAYMSSLGEKIVLPEPIFTTSSVEMWLNELCEKMQTSLVTLLEDYMRGRKFSTKSYPSQIVQIGEGIMFCEAVQKGIPSRSLQTLLDVYNKRLLRFAEFRTKPLEEEADPSSIQIEITEASEVSLVKSLIMDFVNYNSIISDLQKQSIIDPNAFEWMRRFKYFFVDGKCIIKMCDGTFDYGYEYQGNAPKLVHTPLTDLCWSTLCEGMHLGFAGNPYGPAGTGKTESVKALGQAMGRQVLVFNCGDGIDVKSICRIFTGLVQCGAWGCFDEFNRLDELVLSAVSQQIQSIQMAILKKKEVVTLLAKTIPLDLKSGIFVTLNPAGKAYGGRSKLPNNLKALFRSVSMSQPDKFLIAQVMLYSEGFKDSVGLSQRLVTTFSLADQLLSKQKHYDWGLRAQKTVLNMAGQWLRNNTGGDSEEQIIIKALLFDTLGKLDDKDRRLFLDIVHDIFKTDQTGEVSENTLQEAVLQVLQDLKLEKSDSQMTKISLLNQLIQHRTGAVIVGPAGCGKSTVWKVLAEALTKSGRKTSVWHIVPKATSIEMLMGSIDLDTREWTDGSLTRAARNASRLEPDEMGFIVCDGDVDPVWIESLNSVLDDNRLLTLPTGERIQFDRNVKFIFETHSLQFASPATVSRMGVLFVNRADFDIKLTFNKYTEGKSDDYTKLFKQVIPNVIKVMQKFSQHFVFNFTDLQILQNIEPHINGIDDKVTFLLGVTRACSSLLSPAVQDKFADMMMKNAEKLIGQKMPTMKGVLGNEYVNNQIKPYDYIKIAEGEWDATSPPFICTPESQKYLAAARPFVDKGLALLVAGPKGCGKTTLIKKLYKGDVEIIYCNALTSAKSVISRLNELCSSSPGQNGLRMKPRSGRPLTIFFKGVQYPVADKFDTVQLHSFIRQLCQLNGFMNESLDWVELSNINFVASIDPRSSVQPLSERFLSNFRVICLDYVPSEALRFIYGEYLTCVLHRESQWEWNTPSVCYELSKSIVAVYDQFLLANGFTPKDMTNWVLGLNRYADESPSECILYEACRVFADRLPLKKQKEFNQCLQKIMAGKMGVYSTFSQTDNLLRRTDVSTIRKQLQTAKVSYEREIGPLDIFITASTMKLASQINRAIALPGNNLMLIAITGCGGKDIMKLSVHTMKGKVFTPSTFEGYSIRHFATDLKECINNAAFQKQITVFCIEEYQIVDQTFFEYINSLIVGLIPPNLYSNEEQKAILSQLDDINYEEFKKLFRQYFRLVLVIDPRSPQYQPMIKSQPLLEAQCSILNVNDFTENMLNEMVPLILSKLNENNEEFAKLPFSKVHQTLELQSSDFPVLISSFVDLYHKKSENLSTRKKFLGEGLLRLKAVSTRVSQLSQEAEAQQVQVKEKEQRAKEAMDHISTTMTQLSLQSTQMEKIQKELSVKEVELRKQKSEIDERLSGILPLLQAASEKVAKLDSRDISEVKSFAMPPQPVRDVLEAVLLLMGEKDTTWQNIRKYFSSPHIKEDILRFDPHQVSPASIVQVNKAVEKKTMSFDYETVSKCSAAAAPLSQWVKAMAQYCLVLRDVKPLEDEMTKCDTELNSSRAQLQELEKKKIELNDEVNNLQEQFKNFTSEAEKLRISLNEIEEKQQAASSLLNKLSDEQTRWAQQHKDIEAEQSQVTTRLLMSASFMTFCGSLNETDRSAKMVQLAKALETDPNFCFREFINSQSEILELKFNGFPSDELSIENVQIINESQKRTLFIIDPTEKVVEWLEHSIGPAAEVLSSSHPRFQHQVTLAIRFGKKLIVREADSIPLCLFNYLSHEFVMSNDHLTVQVGDKFVDVHPEFRLIIVTRDSSIKLSPRELSLVSLVNFTVTRTALKMQLLTIALSTELPELEHQHQENLNESEQLKIELGKLESSLLDILAAADPNTILSNKELIQSLDDKKKRAVEVEQRLKEAEESQKKLHESRAQYQPLANIASAVYFSVDTLHLIHPMYRFSLNEFTKLFVQCFSACKETENRIKNLTSTFNSIAYSYFSRALFREHRLVFGLCLLKTVYPKMFPDNEWNHLLHQRPAKTDIPSFVPADKHSTYCSFAAAFPQIIEKLKFEENSQNWNKWIDHLNPEVNSSWPQIDGKSIQQLGITALQRILILQSLRPDRVLAALEKLVISTFKNPKTLSIRELMTTEASETVYIFIVTPGSDPSIELKEIALEIPSVGEQNYLELALGECDSKDALSLVRQAARGGQWAIIKNVHLDIGFLQQLEKLIPSLQPTPNFRLVLTTEATPSFPNVLLQNSMKIAYESPPGLLNQIRRTFSLWSEDWFEKLKPDIRKSLISLAYIHGILQERRAFIPLGWSQFFEFTQADLNAASQIIEQRNDAIDVVRGLLETTVYGSRMDSIYDRRVLSLFIKRNFPCEQFPLFQIPSDLKMSSVVNQISSCNMEDGPVLLSLCPNANATVARSNLASTLKFLSTLSSAVASEEESKQTYSQVVSSLSAQFPDVAKDVPVELKNHPAIDFISVQRNTAHALLKVVTADIESLNSAVDSSLLPAHLRSVQASLKNNTVPSEWNCDWIDIDNVDEWLEELFSRTAALDAIADRVRDHSILTSQPFPLYATMRPAAFINAIMQTAVRMNKTEMNAIKLVATFDHPVSGALMSLNICDLDLQAAVVKTGGQTACVSISESPNNDLVKTDRCYISIVPENFQFQDKGIKLPIMESASRERFVCEVEVPSDKTSNSVILASAALVLCH